MISMKLVMLFTIAGVCSSQYDDGFPDSIKTAAFEEIIGNYYAFDPFLQTGRKGRELNGFPDEMEFSSFQPTFDSPPQIQSNDDNTFYSIPPAYTASESKDNVDDLPISVTTRPAVIHDVRQLNDLQTNSPFKFETEFNSFDSETYPLYPPYLTEQSVRQQQQLSPDVTREKNLPKYVIAVGGQEATDEEDDFFQTKVARTPARRAHQSGQRDQFVRRARPAIELDESPFARRSLRYVNYEDDVPQRYNRARSSDLTHRRRAAHELPHDRNIRNGYYIASKVLWRTPVLADGQRGRYSFASRPPVYAD
ncbi:uncharacterized protein LOC130700651 [Daphnia carinata]|uniref:uncharacterized protein LOC130700651 n=1 Tax=Daphnia carinata TaxID=120202 RepID=UPI00257E17AD|nr:uncharacterized protein LOC130700651 [Daphnia carinata]